MIPSIQINKTTEEVGTIHCIVSKQEARKLVTVIALEVYEQLTDRFGDNYKNTYFHNFVWY